MPLFKAYRGNKADLPGGWNEELQKPNDESKMHDGYVYFCADTGEFFVDVDLSGNGSDLKRVPITALTAARLSNGERTIDVDNLYSKEELDDKLKESTTVAYTTTLVHTAWNNLNNEYMLNYENKELKCGAAGNVPPEITFTSNREEYSKIDRAIAEPGVGIKFYISDLPEEDIGIIIIDNL